ncbi:MAG: OsmC family protein [Pseudomonadota bacterium]
MATLGENILGQEDGPLFYKVANADAMGATAPENRKGDALRTLVRSYSGFQKEALIRSARTGDTWRLASDEGAYLNGYDAAPCPLAFLTCGMIASFINEITALAKIQGVEIRKLKLTQDNYYTMQGSMRARTMVGGAENIDLKVEIDCDLEDGALSDFLVNATYASPLNGLMRGAIPSLFKLAKNGAELTTAEARELDAPILPDPVDNGVAAEPVASEIDFITKGEMSPKKDVAKGTAAGGSSLTDHQDRRLNPGASAVMREDGMKEITQVLYSPHGSSFTFLSSEDGRAPDACTLISAGIGFCFMTQFGRFVSMLNLDLPEYRIAQDTHFSLGGASGGTGKAGEADPIETHVFLQTSEPDVTAQEMLDISEKTCFLHAFCRTDLKTKLKIERI